MSKAPNKDFAKRFERLLIEANLGAETNESLGKRFGYSGPTVWNWRNGVKLPSMDTAIRIATTLNVCVEYLLTGRGPKRPGPSPNHIEWELLTPEATSQLEKVLSSLGEQIARYQKKAG